MHQDPRMILTAYPNQTACLEASGVRCTSLRVRHLHWTDALETEGHIVLWNTETQISQCYIIMDRLALRCYEVVPWAEWHLESTE